MRLLSAVFLLLATSLASAQQRYLVDWETVGEETLNHLSELIQINTTNPPGNETLVANYLAAILESENIDTEMFAALVDGREMGRDESGRAVADIEVYAGNTEAFHLVVDGASDDVTWSQFATLIEFVHELLTIG